MSQTVRFSKFSRQNVALIRRLDPVVQPVFFEFLWRVAAYGEYIRITSGKRTGEEQKDEWLKGRPWAKGYDPKKHGGPMVTDVLCPFSFHCHGLAIDVVPLDKIGPIEFKAIYNSKKRYEALARIAGELGITWGYAVWDTDQPHFHYDGGLGIDRVIAAEPIPPAKFTPIWHGEVLKRAINRLLY